MKRGFTQNTIFTCQFSIAYMNAFSIMPCPVRTYHIIRPECSSPKRHTLFQKANSYKNGKAVDLVRASTEIHTIELTTGLHLQIPRAVHLLYILDKPSLRLIYQPLLVF